MRFFQISILIIVLTSCSTVTEKYVLKNKNTVFEVQNNYFSNTQEDYIYKAQISIYGNHLGGILIIKPLAKKHHRIVFTTEFGGKIFDIELKNGQLFKNKVIKKLDKVFIINTLKKDFQILLQEKVQVLKTYLSGENTIYQTEKGKQFNLYFYDKNNQLFEIQNTTKYKKKVMILFSNFEEEKPKSVSIIHRNIKLTIDLKSLK